MKWLAGLKRKEENIFLDMSVSFSVDFFFVTIAKYPRLQNLYSFIWLMDLMSGHLDHLLWGYSWCIIICQKVAYGIIKAGKLAAIIFYSSNKATINNVSAAPTLGSHWILITSQESLSYIFEAIIPNIWILEDLVMPASLKLSNVSIH